MLVKAFILTDYFASELHSYVHNDISEDNDLKHIHLVLL